MNSNKTNIFRFVIEKIGAVRLSQLCSFPSFGGARGGQWSLLLLLLCFSLASYAQKSTVRSTLKHSDILIGQQDTITLEVISPKGRNIQFPIYGDTIVKGVEVIEMSNVDTTMTEVMILKKQYMVTSFDSTLYLIRPMMVVDGSDTLYSNELGLKVTAPQLSDSTLAYLEKLKKHETDSIDFAQLQISDIKDIQDPEFVIWDYAIYLLVPVAVFVFFLLVGLVAFFLTRKKKKGYFFKPKVLPPPHVEALQALEELRNKKLSQKGMEKEYYTEITNIVRHYINRRFGINAPEMITEDIVAAVERVTETESSVQGLKQILSIADLVKFAKYIPFQNENDLSLVNAFLFVNQTKREELPPPGAKPTVGDGQVSTQAPPPNDPRG